MSRRSRGQTDGSSLASSSRRNTSAKKPIERLSPPINNTKVETAMSESHTQTSPEELPGVQDSDAEVKELAMSMQLQEAEALRQKELESLPPPPPKPVTYIHLVDGEKGGVGKSLVSRVMIEYFREKGVPFSAIDADRTNPDVSEIYSDVCKTAYFSDNERQSRELDRVLDWALEKSVIINLPGQVQTLVKQWLERNELLELAAENNITFVKWFVTNGGYGSVKLFTDSVELYKGKLIHVFVRNEGVCPEWDHLAANSNLTGVLLLPHVKAINFPKFYYLERDTVDELKLTFSAARQHPSFGMVPRRRISKFLSDAYAAIEQTGLFGVKEPLSDTNSGAEGEGNSEEASVQQ